MSDENNCPMCEDIFPSIKIGPRPDLRNHPYKVAANPVNKALIALQRYREAIEEQRETEELCATVGVTWRDRHPLAKAISEALHRVVLAEGNLWEDIRDFHRWEVLVDAGWFAYVEARGARDDRDRPRLIVGRVTDENAPECVREMETAQ